MAEIGSERVLPVRTRGESCEARLLDGHMRPWRWTFRPGDDSLDVLMTARCGSAVMRLHGAEAEAAAEAIVSGWDAHVADEEGRPWWLSVERSEREICSGVWLHCGSLTATFDLQPLLRIVADLDAEMVAS